MKAIRILSLLGWGIMLLFAATPAPTQVTSWIKIYGGGNDDTGNSVQQTTDGGYIVVGWTWSYGAGEGDVYLIKTDSLGYVQWSKTYGINYYTEEGKSVQQMTAGGYIVAGWMGYYIGGTSAVYLIKTDSLGDTLWTKTYGLSYSLNEGSSVQQTTDEGYIVVGETRPYGAPYWDIYLLKTNHLGDTLWTKTYNDSSNDLGYSVQQTTDGGYIIAGMTSTYGAGWEDVYVINMDSLGNTLWTKTYGGSGADRGYSIQQTADGGYIVAGSTSSYGVGLSDVYLIKTDLFGDTLWTKTYGGSDYDGGYSVQQTIDGGYIVVGYTWSYGTAGGDVYLIKTDSLGNTSWTKTFGESDGGDIGNSVQQTTDGGYIIAGVNWSDVADSWNVYLIKTDAEGVVGVMDFNLSAPHEFAFHPPSPNPFNPTTVLSFELRVPSFVTLEVFDVNGRVVSGSGATPTMDEGGQWYSSGAHQITFDGSGLPSGIYFAKLTVEDPFGAGEQTAVQKMVLLK